VRSRCRGFQTTPRGVGDDGLDRTPSTEDEVDRIMAACEKVKTPSLTRARARMRRHDDALFSQLSLFTGLRISDIAVFDVHAQLLEDNTVAVRAIKNKRWVYTVLPALVASRLRDRANELGTGKIFVRRLRSSDVETIANSWRYRLKQVYALAGPFADQRPTHHRFSHTSVRRLLQDGVETKDVAQLIGDTESTPLKYYAKWVPER
jgi:integrase